MPLSLRSFLAAMVAASLALGSAFSQAPSAPAAKPSSLQQSSGAATADPGTMPKAAPVPDPHWLLPADIDAIVAGVPEPPAAGSPADQADLKTEIEVQNSRTPERSAQAKKDAVLELSLFVKDVEPSLNSKSDPKLYFFIQQLHRQEDAVNVAIKKRFQRPRPFVAHGDVIHPLGTITGFSYPSGHSTVAFCHAVILGEIFPDKAAVFLDGAKRIAQSRVVMGVHYTTDIQEGERDGREIARELLTKPEFVARLNEVKAEIAHQP
jgi:acid phosphatase (class A)